MNAPAPDPMVARLKGLAAGAALLALGLGVFAWRQDGPQGSGLPAFSQVPAFSLSAQDGRAFDSAALAGKVWVASFVFTSCKNSCPMLTAQMKRLSQALPA